MRSLPVWVVPAVALAVGCTGAQTPAKGADVDPQKIAASEPWSLEELSAEDKDVSPVPAPGETVVHVRWKSPAATATAAAALAQLPKALVERGVPQLIREFVRDQLEDKVNTDTFPGLVSAEAPVDLIVVAVMDQGGQIPDPMFAWSVGLTSLEDALNASKGAPKRTEPGVWEIGTQDKWGAPCAVSAAAGRAPARLVCGENKNHVRKLAAFMARNVAAEADPPHDLRVAVRLRKLLDRYGKQWASQARALPILVDEAKIGNATFDKALTDMATALAAEAGQLVYDLDEFTFDVGIDAQKGVSLEADLRFADKRSWLVKTLIDGADQSGPAPDIAWRVPESSSYVYWGRSGDPARFTPVVDTLRSLADGYLEHTKALPDADRTAVTQLLRTIQKAKNVTSVFAGGHFPRTRTGSPTSIVDVVDDAVGWYVVGFDESSSEVKKWLEEVVQVYNRPGVQQVLTNLLGPDANHLPRVKKGAAPGLGADSLVIEIAIPNLEDPLATALAPASPNQPPQTKTVDLKFYLMLMGDGARTWFGAGMHKSDLEKLVAGLKGKTGPGSLATRTDLDRLKTETHASGGFATLNGIVGMVQPVVEALSVAPGVGMPSLAGKVTAILEQMPNKGQTPMYMFTDIDGGAKPRVHWSANVPRAVVDDVTFVVVNALKLKP